MTMHIECRRWFDGRNGNTYHSAYVYENGELIAENRFEYGYGEQCLETALEALEKVGRIQRTQRENGSHVEAGTRYIREELGASYSIIDVARKRDL